MTGNVVAAGGASRGQERRFTNLFQIKVRKRAAIRTLDTKNTKGSAQVHLKGNGVDELQGNIRSIAPTGNSSNCVTFVQRIRRDLAKGQVQEENKK
jgi:hypothetical protein